MSCWRSCIPNKHRNKKKIPLIIYGEPSSEYGSFFDYDDFEVLDVDYFNRIFSLGLNAEDMTGMVNERFPNDKINENALDDLKFPSRKSLSRNNIYAAYLGDYLPWNLPKFVAKIKKELDWEGEEVEGVPPEYDYEKIECLFQGVRDYLKFLKRGFGRTAHLTSIDIRAGKMTREKALELCKKYDGKRPVSLDYFLKFLNISEDEFYDISLKHVVHPHENLNLQDLKKQTSNKSPKDFEKVFKKLISKC